MSKKVIAILVVLIVFVVGGMVLTMKRSADVGAQKREAAIEGKAKPPPKKPQ